MRAVLGDLQKLRLGSIPITMKSRQVLVSRGNCFVSTYRAQWGFFIFALLLRLVFHQVLISSCLKLESWFVSASRIRSSVLLDFLWISKSSILTHAGTVLGLLIIGLRWNMLEPSLILLAKPTLWGFSHDNLPGKMVFPLSSVTTI